MKLKFPNHFQERIIQRDINIDHVKLAMTNPDKKNLVFEGRIRVTKKIGKKTIEVVYFKEAFRDKKDEYIIITAYYL